MSATIKKTLLLMIAVFALAVPTTAEASGWWWYDHEYEVSPTPTEPKTAEPTGDLWFTTGGVKFGPCEDVKVHGILYNEPFGTGEGTVLNPVWNGEKCGTSLPGCTVLESTLVGFPWELTLGIEKEIVVSAVEVENHLSEQCKAYGLPSTVTITGTVEGQFFDYQEFEAEGPAKVEFKESPGLTVKGPGTAVTLNGFLEFGTKFTATFKL